MSTAYGYAQKFIYYPKLLTPLWSDLLAMNSGYPKIITIWSTLILLDSQGCCYVTIFQNYNLHKTACGFACWTQLGYKLINLLLGPCIKPAKRLSELFHVSLDA